MSVALAAHQDRIASLFESSDRFIIFDPPEYDSEKFRSIYLKKRAPNELIKVLDENKVDVLICGAMNGCIYHTLCSRGLQVIPWITGKVDDVIHAYGAGALVTPAFTMPGCGGRGRHGRHRHFRK